MTRRERWTVMVVILISLGLGIAAGMASERVLAWVYLVGGIIILPLLTIRTIATTWI